MATNARPGNAYSRQPSTLLGNDHKARSVIPVAACDSNAEPTQEDGSRLTWDFACAAKARATNPWIKWNGLEICRIVDTGRR
jgi:hypothetical protein